MTDIAKEKDSMPTPAEKTGGPPSGVGGPYDGSAISGEGGEGNAGRNEGGSTGIQQIQEKTGMNPDEEDGVSPTLSPTSPNQVGK